MSIGSKRTRGNDEYVFIDGKAMRSDEVVRIEVDTAVPGQAEAKSQARAAAAGADDNAATAAKDAKKPKKGVRKIVQELESEDAFALNDDFANGHSLAQSTLLFESEKRAMRRRYGVFVVVLVVLVLLSLCISNGYSYRLYSPSDVVQSIGAWFQLTYTSIVSPTMYVQTEYDVVQRLPMYKDVMAQALHIVKYILCGALLALSGMLYQNAFRNPIAAPSMLGVSNGVTMAILILVLQFGYQARSQIGLYYIYAFTGGIAVLLLVMFGGKWISGKRDFNVVNMLLMGTIISQLLGVIMTYVQTNFLTEEMWVVYYDLQAAVDIDSSLTYVTLVLGLVVSIVPIYLLKFRMNLLSFSDDETKLLGVNATRLRLVALGCGSLMILTAQINAGQVSMLSLVVPFISRYVFGSEFKKQMFGNVLLGAIILLVCGDFVTYVYVLNVPIDLGSIVTIFVMPLFVWMMVVRQRSFE